MKNLNISNELLSNVLSMEVYSNSLSFDSIIFECSLPLEQKVSLYKFAFLCKEWALTKGYKIQSQLNSENKGHTHISKIADKELANGFFENTEVEAIIKACEWILKELNENR